MVFTMEIILFALCFTQTRKYMEYFGFKASNKNEELVDAVNSRFDAELAMVDMGTHIQYISTKWFDIESLEVMYKFVEEKFGNGFAFPPKAKILPLAKIERLTHSPIFERMVEENFGGNYAILWLKELDMEISEFAELYGNEIKHVVYWNPIDQFNWIIENFCYNK